MQTGSSEIHADVLSPDGCPRAGRAICALVAKTGGDDERLWLPLLTHLKDTASVIEYLAANWLPESYCRCLGLDRDDFLKLASAAALLHDIGKSTRLFQNRITERRPALRDMLLSAGLNAEFQPNTRTDTNVPHAAAGGEMLRLYDFGDSLACIVGAHHGKPENRMALSFCEYTPVSFGWTGDGDRNTPWGKTQEQLMQWALQQLGISSGEDLPECSMAAQMLLTGLVIMADWIASNTAYFPLITTDEIPTDYDTGRAARALEKLHLPSPWNISDSWKDGNYFRDRFGFEANDVQKRAERLAAEMPAPGVMILEAPMGHGKTEAALAAAEILMNRFHLGGAAFFLPSQATSNAMFTRMTRWAKHQPDALRVAVELAHGLAEFNADFSQLQEGSVQIVQDEAGSDALVIHSFFRGRKTKLLAGLVVGTVDQLLMAALKQKHVMLRHLGLAGKVVIIDECHAYDAYMNTYLDRVLDWLGAYNVPVILLSATLPGKRRSQLLQAYLGRKKAVGAEFEACREYPLLSWTAETKAFLAPIPPEGKSRRVWIQRSEEADAIREAGRALQHGCVGIIVNTVKRAQALLHLLEQEYPDAVILMDHSRFLSPDRLEHEAAILERVGKTSSAQTRKGVLVIGTQVLEQSLDLDFDLLITDLCPMDLLLQRLGRLHRHTRPRPPALDKARCLVLGAGAEIDSGSSAVYGDYLLLRSRELLPEVICLPEDIPVLVQKTYEEALWSPEPDDQYRKARGEYLLAQEKQRRNADVYRLERPSRGPYPDTIMGLMDNSPGFSDAQARAAVRDGAAAIEVLVVQRTEDGSMALLSGPEKGARYRSDTQPSAEEARAISAQRLRLPAFFSRGCLADAVIGELELQTRKAVPMWLQLPMLEGELFLILDPDGSAVLADKKLYYDSRTGLTEMEETHERDGI